MDGLGGSDELDQKIADMEDAIGGASRMAGAFNGELATMRGSLAGAGREVRTLAHSIDRGLKRALEGLVFDGKNLSEVLNGLAGSIVRATYNAGISPVTRQISGAIAQGIEGLIGGGGAFADGAGFVQGRVMPFASGGIVSGPTAFPMRGGTGLMGEAGPEAIMPLARGADGRLGVRAETGGRPVSVVINVQTPDVEGFRRSQTQLAEQAARALSRAGRNR